jgi:magnesium chelatase subunit I
MIKIEKIKTLGQLKKAGYHSRSIKHEMRDNLIAMLSEGNNPFEDIKGY